MIDLHAIPFLFMPWLFFNILVHRINCIPAESFMSSQSFILGFVLLICLSPLLFGSNKSKMNAFIIILNVLIAFLVNLKDHSETILYDLIKVLSASAIIISPIIILILVLLLLPNKETDNEKN